MRSRGLKDALDAPVQWFILSILCLILLTVPLVPMFVSPVILVVTAWRHRLGMAVAAAGATALFLYWMFHLPMAVIFLMQFACVGLFLGEGLRRKTPVLRLLVGASLVSTVLVLAAAAAYFLKMEMNPSQAFGVWNQSFRHAMAELHVDPGTLSLYQANLDTLTRILETAFPALLFVNSFSIVYINLLISLGLADRMGLDRSHIPPLREISIPFSWVWGLIVGGLLFLLRIPYLKWIGLNLALVYLLAYLMQGFAILSFFLGRSRLPGLVKGVLYLACLVSLPLTLVLCGLGLFDTWFNFRKRVSA